ncbi:hypothetical protein O181_069537 [Austropuccinia psidii MF-1]|uniref:Uncharacterized protein n=1 Tax=Austropuccinia psidii MF-1 TaxID=1389203 RepID=A0A9Q3F1H7_9BASI|nr:hypothetical protein [Austropuccinia psidii MF-1]
MGHLGPFWPNFNESQRGQGEQSLSPKPQVGPPEPIYGPKKALGPLWPPSLSMASGNRQRPPEAQIHSSPQLKGKILPFLHAPHTQGYRDGAYMVLYTIMHHFAQKSDGDVFRTHFHDSKSRSPSSITNFKGGLFSSSV